MKISFSKLRLMAVAMLLSGLCASAQVRTPVSTWLTSSDKSNLFKEEPVSYFSASGNTKTYQRPVIEVNETKKFQAIDGFGFALTGGSAGHLINMSEKARGALLDDLFQTKGRSIGISYIRLSIGSSDLNERVFSYDDLPEGQTDPDLKKFALGPDLDNVVPVMKQILKINPGIKILGSPWSPPAWMKTNQDTRGGRLKPEFYGAYAHYFVKYIQSMKALGITIDAITVQNEPLHPGNNPSLLMVAPDEADFVANFLGPAFQTARIKTKILVYDHNADRTDYPISILNNAKARKYIDGSAFHLYGGDVNSISEVHEHYPEKNLYLTEQMLVDGSDSSKLNLVHPEKRIVIGATRNWCRNVIEWNLAANSSNTPFTERGGCSMCQGAVTIDGDIVRKNSAYYSIAHVSKFVRPGSLRIASNEPDGLSNVAFITPAGKKVLLVDNTSDRAQAFVINYKGKTLNAALPAGSIATYIW